MSNESHILQPGVRAAAEAMLALASASWFARLAPGQALDAMPADAFEHLVAAARALLGAVERAEDAALVGPTPRQLCATYVDTVRLDLGASTLLVLMRDRGARASAAFSAAAAGTMTLNAENAGALWQAVSGQLRTKAGQPRLTAAQEPKP